jgi:hypothetical protein
MGDWCPAKMCFPEIGDLSEGAASPAFENDEQPGTEW